MRYDEWQTINEVFAPVTLGLGRPTTIGGPIGSRFLEADDTEEEEEDDDLFGGDKEEEDGDDLFGGDKEEEDGDDELPGDLFGSDEDDGVEKSFPPDDGQNMDGLPTPDEKNVGGGDMDFLNDIDPELAGMGEEPEGPPAPGEGDMGTPCPKCNDEGAEMEGDPNCKTCMGIGFVPEEGGPEMGGEGMPMGDDDSDLDIDNEMMPKFMSKGCKYCSEQDDFLNSLAQPMTDQRRRYSASGLKREDALLPDGNPNSAFEAEPTPGQPGFAPQQRVGSIGSGYTQDDIRSIPVLGESVRFPTLAEFIAAKERLKRQR